MSIANPNTSIDPFIPSISSSVPQVGWIGTQHSNFTIQLPKNPIYKSRYGMGCNGVHGIWNGAAGVNLPKQC